MIKKKITRRWDKLGFWKYACGCIQYQDGFDLCKKHRKKGYSSLMKDANL